MMGRKDNRGPGVNSPCVWGGGGFEEGHGGGDEMVFTSDAGGREGILSRLINGATPVTVLRL